MKHRFSIALLRPEILHITGAIDRLCVGPGAPLHLVNHLGFALNDRYKEPLFRPPCPANTREASTSPTPYPSPHTNATSN